MKNFLPKFLFFLPLIVLFSLPTSVFAQTAPTPTPTSDLRPCAEIARAGGYNEYGCISGANSVTLGCGNPEDPERQGKCFYDFHSSTSSDCTGITPLCGYLRSVGCSDPGTGKCEQNICDTAGGCILPTFTPTLTPTATGTPAWAEKCLDLKGKIEAAWGKRCGESGYDRLADVNDNGVVNIADMQKVAYRYNDNTWCEERLNKTTDPCIATPTPTQALVCTLDTCYGSCSNCRTNCHRNCTLLTGEDARRICGAGWNSGYQCCNVGGVPCPTSPPQPTNTPRATVTPPSCSCSTGLPKSQGNANCDGFINKLDFNRWLDQFHGGLSQTDCADFNDDRKVDGIDFEYWRRNKP